MGVGARTLLLKIQRLGIYQKQERKTRLTLNLETKDIVKLKINSDHNHYINVVDLAIREVRHKLRQEVTSSTGAPKRIVANAVDGLGHKVSQNLPSDVTLNL